MSLFKENLRVGLDYDKGTVIFASLDGTRAVILWDSDGQKEEFDSITFFSKGEGRIIDEV